MAHYATGGRSVNVPEQLRAASSRWSLTDRLARTRAANPRTTTGAGARRRSSYEHQLDDHLALLAACTTAGAVVTVDRSARLRRSDGARRAARPSAAVLTKQTLEPCALIEEALRQRDGLAASVARTLVQLGARCEANHPARAGWALKQSAPRTTTDPRATAFYLPRRSWRAFFVWRAWVRAVARLLLLLYALPAQVIPLRRAVAPRPKAEESRRPVEQESRAVTTYGDHLGWRAPAARVQARLDATT